MKKKLSLFVFTIAFAINYLLGQCPMIGQNPLTAIPINNNNTYTQNQVSACQGRTIPVPVCSTTGGVNFTDINPFYYRMHCSQSGTLVFLITPLIISDDYDWQLFDVTNKHPSTIYTDYTSFVACNWSGKSGATGTSVSATLNNGCEGTGIPNVTLAPTVLAGHDYLLLVSHFTNTNQSGYVLNFSGGTAILNNTTMPLPTLQGYIYTDNNSNNIQDTLEPNKANVKVQLSNGNFTFTNSNGFYQIETDSIGAYTLTITPPVGYNATPATVSYNFATWDTIINQNIALQPTITFDSLWVDCFPLYTQAVVNGNMPYWINYENTGTTLLSPNIFLGNSKGWLLFDSCTDTNASFTSNGGLITAANNMQPGQHNSFVGYFKLSSAAQVGDTLVTSYAAATNNLNVADSFSMIIQASSVGNGQRVAPTISQADIATGKPLQYTIGFVNDGIDTAFNIIITDTLSSSVQPQSFKMRGSSHSCKTIVKNNIVTFELFNINLPPTSSNSLKNMGFVSFTILPQANLAVGTTITNKANAYSNYRLPITTAGSTVVTNNLLPIYLKSFSGVLNNNKIATLNWQMIAEENVSKYIVEKSTNASTFEPFKTVATNKKHTYQTIDEQPIKGTNYYRLKIEDNAGKYSYSNIVVIHYNDKNSITVFPNPATNQLTISKGVLNNAVENIAVYDRVGKKIETLQLSSLQQTFDISSWAKGLYILSFANGEKLKLIKE